MSQPDDGSSLRQNLGLLLGFALGTLAFHLLVNAFGGYGIFRDEFYYLACSKRLAAGYVDQPPLAMVLLAVSRSLFGQSVFAVRLLPALAHAATVFLGGSLAVRLGGRRSAALLACLAVCLAPIIVGHAGIFQMNAFADLLWAAAAFILALIVIESRPHRWILLGVVMGLGLLNKVDFLWFGAGLAAGLVLTEMRRHLKTPWPYAAAGIAVLMFSPFIVWNITHDFAHLEFIRNATVLLNPVSMALWVPGIMSLLFGREGRRFRILGVIYLTALAVLLANPHSKAEYLAPAYTMLIAAGAVAVGRFAAGRGRGWSVPALAGLVTLSSLIILPMAVPVLPVGTYVRYASSLGIRPSTAEGMDLGQLPQFYADMFGWEGLARDVSEVYLSLAPEERTKAVVMAHNYGEAASLEYYADKYALPRVISMHNNYWIWGYPQGDPGTIIVLGGNPADHRQACEVVVQAAVHTCRYCMPYENNLPIWVCRGLRVSLAAIWRAGKNFT
jgi:hypothetical protein